MKKEGVKRIIVCSSYAVGPGNRRLIPCFLRCLLYHALADKDIWEAEVITSGLEYTIVRPPGLLDVPARGPSQIAILEEGELPTHEISREDVAYFMLKSLEEKSYFHMTPHISWK